jgi:hypothetical protein
MNEWLRVLENHALLPLCSLGMLIGLYRLGKMLLIDIVKPATEKLATKGIETLTHAQSTMTKIEETQVGIVGAITRLEQQAVEQRRLSTEQQDRLLDIDEKLGELGQHVRRTPNPS